MTHQVAEVIRAAGYTVENDVWGMHNDVITDIRKDGVSIIPPNAEVGYDNPYDYLPTEVVDLLDAQFGD